MCGIIANIKRKDDGVSSNTSVLGMFQQQIERGQQGFGFVSFNDTIKAYIRRSDKEDIEKALLKDDARSFLFHHRIPTSTPNLADTTHPIKVSHHELKHDYYVIHNGIISNDTLLNEKHVKLGYEYNTIVIEEVRTINSKISREKFNDSEAFAIDVSRFIEGKQENIESRGSIAFIALQVNKKSGKVMRVFWGRNAGNPLSILLTKDQLILRSIGEKTEVVANTLYCLDLKTWKVEEAEINIGQYMVTSRYDYGQYRRSVNEVHEYNDNDIEWDGSSDDDDEEYGVGGNKDIPTSEEAIISQYIPNKIEWIEERIDELYEMNSVLMDDLELFKNHKNTDAIINTRIEMAKNLERINALEVEIEMLQDGTVDVES